MIDKLLFWVVIAALVIYGAQNGWFSAVTGGVSRFVNGIRSDVDTQMNMMPEPREDFKDPVGTLTVEKTETKASRRSALGASFDRR